MDAAMSLKPSLVFSLQNYRLAEHSSFSALHLSRLVVSPPLGLAAVQWRNCGRAKWTMGYIAIVSGVGTA